MLLGLDLLAAHLFGDYILQSDYQAKEKLNSARIRALHVTLYTLPFALLAYLYAGFWQRALLFVALVWITHFITDSRRWAGGEKWPPKPIVVDQTLHIVQLSILARLLL